MKGYYVFGAVCVVLFFGHLWYYAIIEHRVFESLAERIGAAFALPSILGMIYGSYLLIQRLRKKSTVTKDQQTS